MPPPRAQLKVVADGRYVCVEVTNAGAAASFSGIVQPGRGTASAAYARAALWHRSTDAECRLDTNQSGLIRIAQRDRPPSANEDDDGMHTHPEGPQSWRMCFLKKGVGAALERIGPVRRHGSSEHFGVVLTVIADPPMAQRSIVKSIELEGERAIDADSGDEFRVLDSPRHYHAKG